MDAILVNCAVLLMPGFPLMTAGALLTALAQANEVQEDVRYAVLPVSALGGPVASGQGATLLTSNLDGQLDWQVLWLLGPEEGEPAPAEPALMDLVRRCRARGVTLACLGGGVSILAEAGLLSGHRACAPWPMAEELLSRHGDVVWSHQLWEMAADGALLSAAPGIAVLDLLLAWLGRRHGERAAQVLAPRLGLERGRDARERQPRPSAQGSASSPKLREALALMEANLAEPLPTEDIARLVGVSRRQLERLFKQHLESLPSRYYLELRMQRARRLLQQGSQSILQIGLSCGFSSGPHFSNAYKTRFGHTPREERSARARNWRADPAAVGDPIA